MAFLFIGRVLFLDLGGISQDYFRQINRRTRAIDRGVKPVSYQLRNKTAVIKMRMREQHGITFGRRNRIWLPVS